MITDLCDLPDGDYTFGEFDTLTRTMEYGVTMPDGFSVHVMRDRWSDHYVVKARLEHDSLRWSDDQEAMTDYMNLCGHGVLVMGTDHTSMYREYFLWSTYDENEAWDVAVAAEDLLKVNARWTG